MGALSLRIVVGLLLIIHGFAHWQITTGWGSRTAESSWLLGNMGAGALHSLATLLWVVALLAFVATGLVLFAGVGFWRLMAVVASVLSLLVITLFWQPNMVLGAAVDVGILVALLWVHWPTPQMIGA
jgi:hypothetical protein